MRRVFIAFVATFICVIHAFAVPAEHVEKKVEQADGSLLTIVLNGDENFGSISNAYIELNSNDIYHYEWDQLLFPRDDKPHSLLQALIDYEQLTKEEEIFVSHTLTSYLINYSF